MKLWISSLIPRSLFHFSSLSPYLEGRRRRLPKSSLIVSVMASSQPSGRMLLCVRERSNSQSHLSLQRQFSHGHNSPRFEDGASSAGTRVSHFLPTSRRIVQFSNGKVSTIQSCSQGISKVVETLQQKFPDVPKTKLREKKCREISDFEDNRWQAVVTLPMCSWSE